MSPSPGTELLPVVAIDGPAASGKSTVAQGVARELGIRSFDTGLLYRAAAHLALTRAIPPSDADALTAAIDGALLEIGSSGEIMLNREDIASCVRSPQVEAIVSEVSAHPSVRSSLFRAQRRIAESVPVVMVGRDITTVVVPDAAVRVYLDASVEERARRRYLERQATHPDATYEAVLADLRSRDAKDSSRETAPLMAAEGVTVIHTDNRPVDDVIAEIVAMARGSIPAIDQFVREADGD